MIKHCISLIEKETEEKNYRTYVADILWAIMQRSGMETVEVPRYAELTEKKKEPQKQETAEDVIERISNNLLNMGK